MLQTIEKVGLRWLLRFRKLDMTQPEQRQALVDTFINAIYLYDDKILITFNYKEGTETVAFGEAVKAEKSSDMSARGAPQQQNPNFFPIGEGFGFFVFFGKQNESLASIEKRPRPYHKESTTDHCKSAVRQKGHKHEVR